jgi:hypothetical protein
MSWIRNALLAAAVLVATTAGAQAQTLFARVSVWDAAGTTLLAGGNAANTFMAAASPLVAAAGPLGDYTGIGVTMTATPFAGPPQGVSLSLSNSFSNVVASSTQRLVVEYLLTGVNSPTGTLSLSQNASSSSSGTPGFAATASTQASGGQAGLAALPALTSTQAQGGLPAGFLAGTTSNGTFSPGTSVTYLPNPSTGSASSIGSPYGVYSVFVSGPKTTGSGGTGSFSSALTVFTTPPNPVIPEPATLIGACMGLASLGAYKLRRRQTVA